MDNKLDEPKKVERAPGACIPWEEAKEDMGELLGDEELVKRVWEQNDGMAYVFIWQCLLSF